MRKVFLIALLFLLATCSIPQKQQFTPEYIEKHKGNYVVVIPEFYELVKILIAISDVGLINSNMVNMSTEYHKRVLEHFLEFRHHKALRRINRKIVDTLPITSRVYYLSYRINALAFEISSDNKIVRNKNITPRNRLLFNPIKRQRLEDFMEKSNFRAFFANNRSYYDSLIYNFKKNVPIGRMVNWLSKKFPGIEHDSYKVIISPLVWATQYTRRIADANFSQTIMSVPIIEHNPNFNPAINEMFNSLLVFTEISHHFVNPTTDQNLSLINEVFSEREFWVEMSTQTELYGSPMSIFNEYLTWALFSLYIMDNFELEDVESYLPGLENNMVYGRDFIKFREFNQMLIEIYKNNRDLSIPELYPLILNKSRELKQ